MAKTLRLNQRVLKSLALIPLALVLSNYFHHAPPTTTLWEIPEAGHLGGWAARPQEYAERLVAFFDHALQSE